MFMTFFFAIIPSTIHLRLIYIECNSPDKIHSENIFSYATTVVQLITMTTVKNLIIFYVFLFLVASSIGKSIPEKCSGESDSDYSQSTGEIADNDEKCNYTSDSSQEYITYGTASLHAECSIELHHGSGKIDELHIEERLDHDFAKNLSSFVKKSLKNVDAHYRLEKSKKVDFNIGIPLDDDTGIFHINGICNITDLIS